MGYVFISYSTKDQSDADAFKHLLAKNQIRTWMAPYDIPAGSKYAQVINHAIKECDCFVLLLTNAAQNSVWVAKEVERAVNYRKTIIPIQIEDIVLNEEFEFYISTDQVVLLKKIDENSEEFQKVLTSVILTTGKELGEQSPATPLFKENASLEFLQFELNSDRSGYIVSASSMCKFLRVGDGPTDIVIPNIFRGKPVTQIKNMGFSHLGSLRSITIPSNVSWVGVQAFENCGSLKKIVVDPNNVTLKAIDGILYSKKGDVLLRYPMSKTFPSHFVIPNSVKIISNDSFANVYILTDITIPDSVTRIDEGAFRMTREVWKEAADLKNIYYTGTIEQWKKIEICGLFNSTKLLFLDIPATVIHCIDGDYPIK